MPRWGKWLLWLATIALTATLYLDGSRLEAGGLLAITLVSALVDGLFPNSTKYKPVEKPE
jgi:hypothetical protein